MNSSAQDFTITVDNITEDLDFNQDIPFGFISPGAINIDVNPNFFLEGHTLDIIIEGPCFTFETQLIALLGLLEK